MPLSIHSTFQTLLTAVRDEAEINTDEYDVEILNWISEIMFEIGSKQVGQDPTFYFVQDQFIVSTVSPVQFDGLLNKIESVTILIGSDPEANQEEYGLSAPQEVLMTAPISGYPQAYEHQLFTPAGADSPKFTIGLWPRPIADLIGSTVRVRGWGVLVGVNGPYSVNTKFPYGKYQPQVIREILQRLQIKRNKDAEQIQVMEPVIQRSIPHPPTK